MLHRERQVRCPRQMPRMSTPPDLLELPYAYTQLRMLMHQQFVREAADRGLSLSVDLIEAFHQPVC